MKNKHKKAAPAACRWAPSMRQIRWFNAGLCLVALLVVGAVLLCSEREYLWKVQELNLFLDTPLFFRQQMVTSGGMLTYLGAFFTEFFYKPWLGVLMLCCWLGLMAWVTQRAFKVPARWGAVMLIPIALVVLTDVDLGYWIYYLKLRGHFFAAVMGFTVAAAAVWGYRVLPSRWWTRSAYAVLSAAILYPLAGFYGLLATMLMGIMAWQVAERKETYRYMNCAMAGIAVVAVPLVYYRLVFYQTSSANIFWTGLPLFRIVEQYQQYYLPYYFMVAFMLVLAFAYRPKRSEGIRRPVRWLALQVLVGAVAVWGVAHFWYKDYNFHKELRMQQAMEQEDWDTMLAEAATLDDEPTRAIVMMKNLALFRLGRQGDEMYHYRTGSKASATPLPLHMTQVVGRSIYYNYGQLNYCYRWCLEDGVEFGWRAEYLKYMTRCALVNGEWAVAQKYLDILKHTRYHRAWAEAQQHFVGDEATLRADAAYGPIFHMLNADDQLNSDNSLVEHYLMNLLAQSRGDDPLYQEATLLAALWMKDIQMFWPRFFHYATLHPTVHMPKHYQEAAYLYGNLEKGVDISGMPFDDDVVQSYNEFMATAQQYAHLGEDKLREMMYQRFGHTFYYEYFLIRNQKLY